MDHQWHMISVKRSDYNHVNRDLAHCKSAFLRGNDGYRKGQALLTLTSLCLLAARIVHCPHSIFNFICAAGWVFLSHGECLLQAHLSTMLFSETEKHREKERLAAIAIQTNWRMLKVKWSYKKKVRACILISRVFRGHINRLRVDGIKQYRNQQRQVSYYARMATIV